MISCYELRLGNQVLVNKKPQQVSMINKTSVSTIDTEGKEPVTGEHSLEKVQPVPMTDDILKQCGFTFHPYFKFWQLINTDPRSEMNIDHDYAVLDFMRKPIGKTLTSLHQLQNVYFLLMGRELKLLF